jgi:nucleoid-associated protein YgaU
MPKRDRIILAVGICIAAFLFVYFAATPSAHRQDREPVVEFDGNAPDPAPKPIVETAASPADQPVPPTGFKVHTVRRGETMQSIAKEVYGDEAAWALIAHENPLQDPLKLRAGTKLRLPPADHRRPGEPQDIADLPSAPLIHVVKRNETLGHIALFYYGKASKADLIFRANRDKLTSPDSVRVGMKLTIPPDPEEE